PFFSLLVPTPPATYTLSLHDALPISVTYHGQPMKLEWRTAPVPLWISAEGPRMLHLAGQIADGALFANGVSEEVIKDSIRHVRADRKSTRLNSSHGSISYAVFCLKKK